MTTAPEWIGTVLSPPRFAPYLDASGHDLGAAIELYWWNLDISAAFYRPLHCLELALRNSVNDQLFLHFGRSDWWTVAPLTGDARLQLARSANKLAQRGHPHSPDDIVAALTFGFWVSLLGKNYDRGLWVPCLHRAFPYYRDSRKELHNDLHRMLWFRNRVMHHEPILHRRLDVDHATLIRLVGYISPSMVKELAAHDEVAQLLQERNN
jgi:hypothetical protein